jgi:hypothetical protein
MEEKELPGAPPQTEIKPKAPDSNVLKFSYFEMSLDGAFQMGEEKFLRFFVDRGSNSFFLEILKDDYMYFFDLYTDLWGEAEENESCTCSELNITEYEEVDEINIIINGVDANTNEKIKVDENYKVYLVFNLAEALTFGLHNDHNINEPIKD